MVKAHVCQTLWHEFEPQQCLKKGSRCRTRCKLRNYTGELACTLGIHHGFETRCRRPQPRYQWPHEDHLSPPIFLAKNKDNTKNMFPLTWGAWSWLWLRTWFNPSTSKAPKINLSSTAVRGSQKSKQLSRTRRTEGMYVSTM